MHRLTCQKHVIQMLQMFKWCHKVFWMQPQRTGADSQMLKRRGAQSGPPWLETKKILGFRWSKKVKITLETISFWWNVSISIFKFSPFLCTIEAYRWNLFNFSKLTNALIRKEKERSYSSQWEKKNWGKLYFVL